MNDQPQGVDLNNTLIDGPVQPQERIEVLDVIRGFALLGILIVNMAYFSYPLMYLEILGREMWTAAWDKAVFAVINLFVEGKFYSMFSFLFGLGFVIFIERARARSSRPTLLFYRRLFILLLIGLVHAFFIWFGDILVSYALLGLLLPLFFNRKPKTILIWIAVFFFIAVLPVVLMVLSTGLLDEAGYAAYMQEFFAVMESKVDNSLYAYSQGTFAELMAQRVEDTLFTYNYFFFVAPLIFPMFLLGLYVGKRGVFQNIEANLPSIKRIWKWSFIIGFTMSIVKYTSKLQIDPAAASLYDLINMGARVFADPGLSIFYMTSIVLLYQNRQWMERLKPLAYVGRMALSNYLFQSLVCTTIFYSYGLGLYGQVGHAAGMVLTIIIFTAQIYISRYWLERYRFGPMEWVWRTLTYGKLSGMKLRNS